MKISFKHSLMIVLVLVLLVGGMIRIDPVRAGNPMLFHSVPVSLPSGWTSGDLSQVWGLGIDDVYAVGNGNNGSKTAGLIYHYDGNNWNPITPSIPVGWGNVYLTGIWGSDAEDIYAVGYSNNGSKSPLAYHYDGTSWTSSTLSKPHFDDQLNGIWGFAANNIYAVGSGYNGLSTPIVYQYDGTTWNVMPLTVPSGFSSAILNSAWGSDLNNLFAVGWGTSGGIGHPVVYYYNGSTWSNVNPSSPSGWSSVSLRGVWGSSATNVYSVGSGRNGSTNLPLIYQYNGTTWSNVSPALPDGWTNGYLFTTWGTGSDDVYAGGYDNNGTKDVPLLYHFDGNAWSPVSLEEPAGWGNAYLKSVWGGSSHLYSVGTGNNGIASVPLVYQSEQLDSSCPTSITVTSTNDDGAGSLRQAIADVCDGGTIDFDAGLSGAEINITATLNFDKTITLDGSGQSIVGDGQMHAAGGVFSLSETGNLTMNELMIRNGMSSNGGGIYVTQGGTLSMESSTISGNNAVNAGGGIYNDGTLILVNSTVVENQAAEDGGGIFNSGVLSITNSTISNNGANVGGGIHNMASLDVDLANTIIANSVSGGDCYNNPSEDGALTFSEYNLIEGTGADACGLTDGNNGNIIGSDPGLDVLADNGGATQTMALLEGSPAIDAGAGWSCPSTDQRGAARPWGGLCDIGAYEYEPPGDILYVKWNASGANNGTSWTNAYTDLQSALAVAFPADDIWVAAGTYKPTTGTNCTISFALKDAVAVYGGFAGTETLLTQRDPAANVTILSGDIGVAGNQTDNSYHVVSASLLGKWTILDGFTITAGHANGNNSPDHVGGGAYIWGSIPKLTNLIFENNYGIQGGGLYVGESSPTLTDVTFRNNSAGGGGGMYTFETAYFDLTNVTFENNSAGQGGAMFNDHGFPSMMNVKFAGNSATAGSGGAIYNKQYSSLPIFMTDVIFDGNSAQNDGGAIYNATDSASALTSVTFMNNSANRGGGIYNQSSDPVLTDVTFTGNSAVSGGGIFDFFSDSALTDVTFSNNTAEKGGGIYADASGSNFTRVTFDSNSADYGGGIYAFYGGPILNDGFFKNNTATVSGGGMYNDHSDTRLTNAAFTGNSATRSGGGIANLYSDPVLTNITFRSNTAGSYGGALAQSFSNPTLTNTTFSGNSAPIGGGMVNDLSNPLIVNSILYGNPGGEIHNISSSANVSHSIVLGGYPGVGNLNLDPLLGAFQDNGGFTPTMALGAGSPAIDSADDTACPDTDQRGVARPQGDHCDIGAYETEGSIKISIGGVATNSYSLSSGQSKRVSFAGVNNGPVKLIDISDTSLIAAERVIYKAAGGVNTSFSEMMGLPENQLDTIYWLPWYNNVDLDTQLRFGNVSGSTATVHILIGGQEMDGSPFDLAPGASIRKSFPGINGGPVKIVSNEQIVAAERVIYKVKGVNTSFTEMMALPNTQLDTAYWLPWYNNVDLDTQLRFANVSDAPATVHVYVGTREVEDSPFTLVAGQSTRKSFVGVNNGPLKIVSDQKIVAAERVIYKIKGNPISFSEMMALPNAQLDTTYWLPWYNNVDLDTQLRFANVSDSPATVHIYVGSAEMEGSPFTLGAGQSTRKSFASINNGPVQVVSDVPIVAAERVIYKIAGLPTSFAEMMGLPGSQLDVVYWLPWYNNVDLDTQLRFGVP